VSDAPAFGRGRKAIAMAPASKTLVVLVVEDEYLIRQDIVDHLEEAGCQVLEAQTGEQAISMCRAGTAVDVLFTDVQLNGPASGWDVAEAFRARRDTMPVVYASGNGQDRSRCVRGSVFFAKPYRPADVLTTCRHLKSVADAHAIARRAH
jgi:CheY-like chemotaxis protein